MTTPDPLTAEQRIRLEAVAQANLRLGPNHIEPSDRAIALLLREAQRIERYIATGTGVPA